MSTHPSNFVTKIFLHIGSSHGLTSELFDWSKIKEECLRIYNASGYCLDTLVGHFGSKNLWPGYVACAPLQYK